MGIVRHRRYTNIDLSFALRNKVGINIVPFPAALSLSRQTYAVLRLYSTRSRSYYLLVLYVHLPTATH